MTPDGKKMEEDIVERLNGIAGRKYGPAHPMRRLCDDAAEEIERLRLARLCEDCPPVGYPTDVTRCTPCPRRPTPASPAGGREALVDALNEARHYVRMWETPGSAAVLKRIDAALSSSPAIRGRK